MKDIIIVQSNITDHKPIAVFDVLPEYKDGDHIDYWGILANAYRIAMLQ